MFRFLLTLSLLIALSGTCLHAAETQNLPSRALDRYREIALRRPAEGAVLDRLWDLTVAENQIESLLSTLALGAAAGRPNETLLYALLLKRQGRLLEASTMFHLATVQDPSNPDSVRQLAGLLEESGQYEEAADAMTAFDPAQIEDPTARTTWWVDSGRFQIQAGRILEAEVIWEKALKLEPNRVDLRKDLAAAYERSERLEAAADAWSEIATRSDGYERAMALRERLRILMLDERDEEALALMDELLRISAPTSWLAAEVRRQRFELCEQSDLMEELRKKLEAAHAANPRQPQPLEELLAFYERQFEIDQIDRVLGLLIELQPKNAAWVWKRSRLAMETGQIETAMLLADEALAIDPAQPDWIFERASLELIYGDRDEALQNVAAFLAANRGEDSIRLGGETFYRQHRLHFELAALLRDQWDLNRNREDLDSLTNLLMEDGNPEHLTEAITIWNQWIAAAVKPEDAGARSLEAALIFRKNRRNPEALEFATDATTIPSLMHPAQLLISELHLSEERWEEAATAAQTAWDAASEPAGQYEADQKLLQVFQSAPAEAWGNPSEVVNDEHFLTAIDRHTATLLDTAREQDTVAAWLRVARWQAWSLQNDSALLSLREALRIEPESAETLESIARIAGESGQPRYAMQALEKLCELYPERSMPWRQEIARHELSLGNPEAAIAALALAIEQPGVTAGLLHELAVLKLQTQQPEEAIPLFERVLALEKSGRLRVETIDRLALLRQAQGDIDGAIALLETEIGRPGIENDRKELLERLIRIARSSNRVEEVSKRMESRFRANPADPVLLHAASSLMRLGNDPNAALRLLRRSALTSPDPDQALGILVNAAVEEWDFPAAIRFQRRLSTVPAEMETPDARIRLAELQELTGRTADAARTWQQLLNRFPNDALVLEKTADWLTRTGDWAEAAELRVLLAEASSEDARAQNHAAYALVELDRPLEAAAAFLQQAAKMPPVNDLQPLYEPVAGASISEGTAGRMLRWMRRDKLGKPRLLPQETKQEILQRGLAKTQGGEPAPRADGRRGMDPFSQVLPGRLEAIRESAALILLAEESGQAEVGELNAETLRKSLLELAKAPQEQVWAHWWLGDVEGAIAASKGIQEALSIPEEELLPNEGIILEILLRASAGIPDEIYDMSSKFFNSPFYQAEGLLLAYDLLMQQPLAKENPEQFLETLFPKGKASPLLLRQAAALAVAAENYPLAIAALQRFTRTADREALDEALQYLSLWYLFTNEETKSDEAVARLLDSPVFLLSHPALAATRNAYWTLAPSERSAWIHARTQAADQSGNPQFAALQKLQLLPLLSAGTLPGAAAAELRRLAPLWFTEERLQSGVPEKPANMLRFNDQYELETARALVVMGFRQAGLDFWMQTLAKLPERPPTESALFFFQIWNAITPPHRRDAEFEQRLSQWFDDRSAASLAGEMAGAGFLTSSSRVQRYLLQRAGLQGQGPLLEQTFQHLVASGDWQTGAFWLRGLRESLSKSDPNFDALNKQLSAMEARLWLRMNRPGIAASLLEPLQVQAGETDLTELKAKAAFEMGDYAKVSEWLAPLIREGQGGTEAIQHLAEALHKTERTTEALRLLEETLRPATPALLRVTNSRSDTTPLIRLYASIAPPKRFEGMARQAMASGDFQAANEQVSRWIQAEKYDEARAWREACVLAARDPATRLDQLRQLAEEGALMQSLVPGTDPERLMQDLQFHANFARRIAQPEKSALLASRIAIRQHTLRETLKEFLKRENGADAYQKAALVEIAILDGQWAEAAAISKRLLDTSSEITDHSIFAELGTRLIGKADDEKPPSTEAVQTGLTLLQYYLKQRPADTRARIAMVAALHRLGQTSAYEKERKLLARISGNTARYTLATVELDFLTGQSQRASEEAQHLIRVSPPETAAEAAAIALPHWLKAGQSGLAWRAGPHLIQNESTINDPSVRLWLSHFAPSLSWSQAVAKLGLVSLQERAYFAELLEEALENGNDTLASALLRGGGKTLVNLPERSWELAQQWLSKNLPERTQVVEALQKDLESSSGDDAFSRARMERLLNPETH